MKDLEITIEQHAIGATVQCGICGEVFEEHQASAVLAENAGEVSFAELSDPFIDDTKEIGRLPVCPTCLDAGPTKAAERAAAHAANLRNQAADLYGLATRIQNIHPENWATAKELADAEWKRE